LSTEKVDKASHFFGVRGNASMPGCLERLIPFSLSVFCRIFVKDAGEKVAGG
jgi:hypothetical protein